MADWVAISSLATAGGTLVLAGATYASVRSAKRSALASERALLAGTRPLIVPSRLQDPDIKIGFMDDHWVHVPGGCGIAQVGDDAIYFAISIRNVGNGLALLDRWDFCDQRAAGSDVHRDPAEFRRLTIDLYVAAGDTGYWLGTFRDTTDPTFAAAARAIEERRPMTLDLLYSDHEGGQHTISRFTLRPRGEDGYLATASRHWNLDRADPR
jgi:hypothetical protein